ncbi:MAG: GNAT family N-acetyltransferase, partial [Solirubrobacteraceae bacterium]
MSASRDPPADAAGDGRVQAEVQVRSATPRDVALLRRMIVELAAYERERDAVIGTEEMLERALFGPRPSAEALIAELGQEPVGFAIFCGSFSTWEALPGIWLEDLYVRERNRGSGAGRALLTRLAELTLERGCARLEWNVLDWNEPALGFYERIGAEAMPSWRLHRLAGDAL